MRLTKKVFVEWLKSKTGYVGARMKPESCPIATFYREFVGAKYVEAASDIEYTKDGKRWYIKKAPFWAEQFMNDVDNGGVTGTLITVEEALEILNVK
jgi:hypothetical protein